MPTPTVHASVHDYDRMMNMVTGPWIAQIVRAAATFNFAEHLAEGSRTAESIAVAESTDPDATRRLLRACASLGLVTSTDGVDYAATPLLGTLRKGDPQSLRGMALAQAEPGHWLPWLLFPEAVRSGRSQFTAAHGEADTIFEYFSQHPEEAGHFTEAMSNMSTAVAADMATITDTRGVGFVLDVGGASGAVVRAIMRANPDLRGGVLDLPHVVLDAAQAARDDGLDGRFTAVAGDFFESVPPADLYLLKYVLHDWDDHDCHRILKNCRTSLRKGGRVVVLDYLVGDLGLVGMPPLMDMTMLVMNGGKERDLAEFDTLFAAAGLRRTTVGQAGPLAVIEAVAK